MVKIFCLAPVADVANFGQKGQRSRSEVRLKFRNDADSAVTVTDRRTDGRTAADG